MYFVLKYFLLNLINDNRLRGQNIDGQGGVKGSCLHYLSKKIGSKIVTKIGGENSTIY